MAVNKVPQTSRLEIKVQAGVNTAGNPVFRQRSFANIKTAAADSDVLAVAQGIASLQKNPVSGFSRIDESDLVNG